MTKLGTVDPARMTLARCWVRALLAVVLALTVSPVSAAAVMQQVGVEETFVVPNLPFSVYENLPEKGAGTLSPANPIDTYRFSVPNDGTHLHVSTHTCHGRADWKFRLINERDGSVVKIGTHDCSFYHRIIVPAGSYALSVMSKNLDRQLSYGLKVRATNGATFPWTFGSPAVPGPDAPRGAGYLENNDSIDEYEFEVPDVGGTVSLTFGHNRPSWERRVPILIVPFDGDVSIRMWDFAGGAIGPGKYRMVVGNFTGGISPGPYAESATVRVVQDIAVAALPATIDSRAHPRVANFEYTWETETFQLPERRQQAVSLRLTDCQKPGLTVQVTAFADAERSIECNGKPETVITTQQGRFSVRSAQQASGRYQLHIDPHTLDVVNLPSLPVTVAPNVPYPGVGVFADGSSVQEFMVPRTVGQTTMFVEQADCKTGVPLVLLRPGQPGRRLECGKYAHIELGLPTGEQDGAVHRFSIAPARLNDGTIRPGTNLRYSFKVVAPTIDQTHVTSVPFGAPSASTAAGIGRLEDARSVDRYVFASANASVDQYAGGYLTLTDCPTPTSRVKYKMWSPGTYGHPGPSGVVKCGGQVPVGGGVPPRNPLYLDLYPEENQPFIGTYTLRLERQSAKARDSYAVIDTPDRTKVGVPVAVSLTFMEFTGSGFKAVPVTSGFTLAAQNGSCEGLRCTATGPGAMRVVASIDSPAGGPGKYEAVSRVLVDYNDQPELQTLAAELDIDWRTGTRFLTTRATNVGNKTATNVVVTTLVYDDSPRRPSAPPVGVAGRVCTFAEVAPAQSVSCAAELSTTAPALVRAVSRATTADKEFDYANNTITHQLQLPIVYRSPQAL